MELAIPVWAQQITVFVIMVCSGLVGLWRYFKTEAEKVTPKQQDTGLVTAATFVDTKLLRELIDTLREHQEEMGRHSQRVTRAQNELRESIIEVNESLHLQTNATLNMVRFLNRQEPRK